jgi:hypothetical protein
MVYGWFMVKTPIEMDDLGVHFRKPSYANMDFLEGPSLGFD